VCSARLRHRPAALPTTSHCSILILTLPIHLHPLPLLSLQLPKPFLAPLCWPLRVWLCPICRFWTEYDVNSVNNPSSLRYLSSLDNSTNPFCQTWASTGDYGTVCCLLTLPPEPALLPLAPASTPTSLYPTCLPDDLHAFA
jgi:hypothetical protein